jgi:dTDP-4-amino-4,6-dideoxygalactose transaminase
VRLRPDLERRLRGVLDHGAFILGPEVGQLEEELAAFTGARHAICVSSGTDALLISLLAEGVGPGDAVFVPALTFVATAGAVLAAGATPVFCDVDPATFCLDARDLARRVLALPARLRPRAVIPVDLFGQPAGYPDIAGVAERCGLFVLADAAQSFGGTFGGRRVGRLAAASATSFFPTKPLGGFGDGGAVFTDDDALAARVRAIRVHGQNESGVFERPGLNGRLDTLQAAVLLAKLDAFEADLARRAAIATRYDGALGGHVGLQTHPPGSASAHAVYAILCDERDRVRTALANRDIGTRIYYETPLHRLPAMQGAAACDIDCPVSEDLCRRILCLPIYPDLSDAAIDRVCAAIVEAVEHA